MDDESNPPTDGVTADGADGADESDTTEPTAEGVSTAATAAATDAAAGTRRKALIGGGIAVVLLVVLVAVLWSRSSSGSSDDANGESAASTSTTITVSTPSTVPLGPDVTNAEGGRTPTSPPPSSTTIPADGTTAPGGPSNTTPDGGSAIGPATPGAVVTWVSGPSTVFRAGPSELSCGSNDTPFVVDAPGAEGVILRWSTGPANGEMLMVRSPGGQWTAILLGPMSPTPTIDVHAIAGTAVGPIGTSEPMSIELADCPR